MGTTLPPRSAVSLTALDRGEHGQAARATCRHCGATLIDARMRETGFCCAGCSYVHRLVHEHGLDGYYRIKDDVTTPADAAVFEARDYTWLESAQRAAEAAALGAGTAAPSLRLNPPGSSALTSHSKPTGETPVPRGMGVPPMSEECEVRAASSRPEIPELTLDVQGISCAGCVWLIERVFQQLAGARDIVVNPQYGTMRLRWVRGEFSAAGFARKLQAFGYLTGPAGETVTEPESRRLVKRIGLCAAFAMNVMLYSLPAYFGMERTDEWAGLFGILSLGFGTLSLLVGGTYFLGRAVRAVREGAMHIDLPIAIGIAGAYAGSLYGWLAGEERFVYFDFVSAFIFLMLVGRWAQVSAVERNRRRLLSQQPKPPRVRLADGTELPPEQLRSGQEMILRAGSTLPVESRLETAAAEFSLASINGEAEPRLFRAGQRVPAGGVAVSRGEVRLVALQAWSESLLAVLLRPGGRRSEREVWLEKIVRGYLIGILAVAAFSGLGWWWATGDALRTWSVVTAVLVVSCPCAIGLAFPLADEMAAVALRRRGVFVREAGLWSKLRRVRKLVFDKTGTLTLETPVLQNPEALQALSAPARAALLALVQDNPHPISQCLLENLLAAGPSRPAAEAPSPPPAEEVRETVGLGVELGPWSLGRAGWRDSASSAAMPPENQSRNAEPAPAAGPPPPASGDPSNDRPPPGDGVTHYVTPPVTPPPQFGESVTYYVTSSADASDAVFARDGRALARFQFVDTARPEAREEIAALGRKGFSLFILSGDRREKVGRLAGALGLPAGHALGELTPQAKADWIAARGSDDVLMLGDGANDSLAFDRALCRGTPVIHRSVLERKADFYYLGRGIGGVRALFEVNAIRHRTQVLILFFSVTYNLLAVGLAVAGKMNPLVAAVLMPVNSLLTLAIVTGGMRTVFAKQ